MYTSRAILALALFAVLGFSTAHAQASYTAVLDGASESPPVVTPGNGTTIVDVDPVLHTMRVRATFADLIGTTTASHIHGPTAVAFTGNAGVMTTTPSFTGFPLGVMFGTYDHTYDMTLATSYNPAFITANGGSIAASEAALFQAIADGKAYLNIHSSFRPGGEIRGFLIPAPLPTEAKTWGGMKALYR